MDVSIEQMNSNMADQRKEADEQVLQLKEQLALEEQNHSNEKRALLK